MTKTSKESSEVKVSKITLKVEGQEIEVTPEGAEKLYDALKGMFDKTITVAWPAPIIVREPYYPRPYWEWTSPSPIITYGDNSDNTMISYSNINIIDNVYK